VRQVRYLPESASKFGYVISKLRKISATVKWPELEADISTVSNSKVTYKWSYVSYLILLSKT